MNEKILHQNVVNRINKSESIFRDIDESRSAFRSFLCRNFKILYIHKALATYVNEDLDPFLTTFYTHNAK